MSSQGTRLRGAALLSIHDSVDRPVIHYLVTNEAHDEQVQPCRTGSRLLQLRQMPWRGKGLNDVRHKTELKGCRRV